MKRNICLLGVGCVVATVLLFIGSCSTDVEEAFPDDLSIEGQIPRVKRTSPEGIPVNKDECALYALMLVKHNEEYWNRDSKLADSYYRRMYKTAKDSCGYTGGEMNESTLLFVGKKFGIINEKESFNLGTSPSASNFTGKQPLIIGIPGHVGKFVSFDPTTKMVDYLDSTGRHTCSIDEITTIFY